jgi:hypothetical protein
MFDSEKVTRALIVGEGFRQNDIIEVSLNEIFVPFFAGDRPANTTRPEGLDALNIASIQSSMRSGIDYSKPLMIIKKLSGVEAIINGKTYKYILIAGFHRMAALQRLGKTIWLFDLYTFDNTAAEIECQVKENNHSPSKPLSINGLAKTLTWFVDQRLIPNTEDGYKYKVKQLALTNVHPKTKAAAIKLALRQNGGYSDILRYEHQDIINALNNPDNYTKGLDKYVYGGELDPIRKELGFAVKEGNEAVYLLNAARGYLDYGRPSYFIAHTTGPVGKVGTAKHRDLQMKRNDMKATIIKWEECLDKCFEYKQKHGVYPWRIESFLKQDNNSETETFIEA